MWSRWCWWWGYNFRWWYWWYCHNERDVLIDYCCWGDDWFDTLNFSVQLEMSLLKINELLLHSVTHCLNDILYYIINSIRSYLLIFYLTTYKPKTIKIHQSVTKVFILKQFLNKMIIYFCYLHSNDSFFTVIYLILSYSIQKFKLY